MDLSEQEQPLCARCMERPAVKEYVYRTMSEMVCSPCFDRWTLQDMYGDQALEIDAMRRRRQYDEALAHLDAILETNRDRDHDGYLARSIAYDRAMTLLIANRYTEALEAFNAGEKLGFEDVSLRWMNAHGAALTLEALGRDREAVTVLEEALGHQDPRYLPSARWVLMELVRLSEKAGQAVDPRWLRVAEAVANRYGVDMPVRDSPGEAILALAAITKEMQPKRRGE
jgi:tetratricopeptide (TPR) repeat protein